VSSLLRYLQSSVTLLLLSLTAGHLSTTSLSSLITLISNIIITSRMVEDNKSEVNGSSDAKIASQIEYYFGDWNLRRDKFLKEKMAENDGWIEIDILLTFNRLKALTESRQEVVDALKKAKIIGHEDSLLLLNEEETKIKRATPVVQLTEEEEKELNDRTIHFKGIPQDATLEEIRAFCSQYGKVESVEMRKKREDRTFKGCVMCVYTTKEDATRAVEGTEVYSPDITFLRETKTDYFARKKKWMREKAERRKNQSGSTDVKEEPEEDPDPVKTKGAVLVLSDFEQKDVRYNTIKDYFKKFGDVKYVELFDDTKKCYIRFSSPEEASFVVKESSIKEEEGEGDKPVVTFNEKKYPVSILEGDDEVSYWRSIQKAKNASRNYHNAHRKGRGFKRGGGGYRGSNDRKRPAGNDSKPIAAKQAKTEAV